MILIHGLQLTFSNQNNVTQQPQKNPAIGFKSYSYNHLLFV